MITDFKTEVMKEASAFITQKLEDVARVLTSEHHRIIEQFIFYKNKTETAFDLKVSMRLTVSQTKYVSLSRCWPSTPVIGDVVWPRT